MNKFIALTLAVALSATTAYAKGHDQGATATPGEDVDFTVCMAMGLGKGSPTTPINCGD
ncbi:MAG TPA: hypothetical protein VLA51_01915 [Paracoccaceae bacterium]|nr:hypothetical protein [Paracoccaceae bacterium]